MTRRALSLSICCRSTLLSFNHHATSASSLQLCHSASTAAAIQRATEQHENLKPFSTIPGPKPLPVLRNLLDFRRNSSRLTPFWRECYEKYGEIFKMETPGGNNFVFMADPSCMENILRAEGKYPRRDITLSSNVQWILNKIGSPTSLGFRSGEDWKKGRSAINKQIKPSSVQVYTPGLNSIATRFTDYLKSIRKEDERISDISTPLRRLLLEMSAKFVYNADIDVLVNPTEETEEFIEGVTLSLKSINRLTVEPPLFKIYPTKLYKDFKKGYKAQRKFGMKHANIARDKINSGEENEVQGLLEQWLREGRLTEAEALMTSADMFGAGVDTTANQAAFMLYFMAKNPEAQEKLHQEIKSVLGDCSEPTPEDISKMPYLKACMMESFRMQPTINVSARVLAEDTSLMGYHIPADTHFFYMAFIASMDERFFPNPERFDPERWTRDKPNPFANLPFGFGPRSCYGRRFAELELKLILLQMTREFVLDTELENLPVEYELIIRPEGDLPLYLKDRF